MHVRVPGTTNYPDAKKRAKGRVPVPVKLLAHDAAGLDITSPDDLKAAIVVKYPNATFEAQTRQSGPFGWQQRDRAFKPMSAEEIKAVIENEKWLTHADKRSAGCAAFIKAARLHGYAGGHARYSADTARHARQRAVRLPGHAASFASLGP